MTPREASRMFGLSEETVRRWIRRGHLPAARAGRVYSVDERDVRITMALRQRRGRPTHIRMTRRIEWVRRMHHPTGFAMGLGMPGETWLEEAKLPGYAAFVDATVGQFKYPPNAGYELTCNLLPDVIEAAAAVEYTVDKIHDAVAKAEAAFRDYIITPSPSPEPIFGRGVSHPGISEAYTEFVNLVSWVRTLDERLDHSFKDDKYGRASFGLIPSLAEGLLKSKVLRVRDEFRSAIAAEAREISNFVLHYSTVPYPLNSNADILQDRLALRIPDRSTGHLRTRGDLRYSEGRTLHQFADRTWSAVDQFVTALLDAFEQEMPARVRR